MNYSEYLMAIQQAGWVPTSNTDFEFQRFVPRVIEYAEMRIYRMFDFLATLTSQVSALTANNRNLAVPATVIVIENINVITPAATAADAGVRHPLRRVSLDFLDAVYPNASLSTGVPKYFAVIGNGAATSSYVARFGPTPDAAYNAEFLGTIRPAPLSETNSTTFISVNMPDLLISASMVMVFGYQRDFGGQSDDPQKAISWEKLFNDQCTTLNIENLRQKAMSADWSSITPSPAANTALGRVSPQ